MSTKGTVTLEMQTFVSWNGATAATADTCTAKGYLDSSDNKKISIDGGGTTDFTININKHGSNTTLAFIVTPGEVSTSFASFIPIGIALRQTDGDGCDPIGTKEFAKVTIADDADQNRVLTLNVDANEDATWDFYIVIQGVPSDDSDDTYPVGIIDPRIKGSTQN